MKIDSKSKKLLIILTPIILLVIVLGVSFAYWRKTSTQSGINKIDTLDCLEITFTDLSNAINLEGDYPISDSEGMTRTPYIFKITNNCDVYTELDINLEVLSESTLSSSYVKTAFNNTISILSSYPSATPTIAGATSFKLVEGVSLFPNDSEEFHLRLWIDEPTTAAQGANITFQGKITVASSVATMPVNLTIQMPVLPSNSYNTDFVGATWNHKLAGIEITSLNSINQVINLTPKTESTVNLTTHIMGLGEANGVYNEPSTDYRYEGENPDNFIYFNNELWSIIGVFSDNTHGKTGEKLVKIIRNDPLGSFAWAKNNVNNWPSSSLYTLLNTNYYNGEDEVTLTNCYQNSTTIAGNCNFKETGITNSNYRNMIEEVTWPLGGIESMTNVNDAYTAERGTTVYSGRPTETTGYIGLMYASDYGYSVLASSCARTTSLGSYGTAACAGKAWLRGEGYEWTLVPHSSNAAYVWNLSYEGNIKYNATSIGISTRPSLYLKSDVKKLTGMGSFANPYIIIMEQ